MKGIFYGLDIWPGSKKYHLLFVKNANRGKYTTIMVFDVKMDIRILKFVLKTNIVAAADLIV